MPDAAPPSRIAALCLGAPAAALAVWGCLQASGGLAPGAASLIAAGSALGAAVLLALCAVGRWPLPRLGLWPLLAVGGLVAFAAVAALSATWSLSAQASVETAVLASGYLGALVLGLVAAPVLARPGTIFAVGLAALATAASGTALVARSFAATSGVQYTPRLAGTIAIPNLLAGLALAGLFGGIALAAHRNGRLRAIGGAVAGVNALALVLTSSRSGLGLAVAGAAVLVLALPASPRLRAIGVVAAAPALAIGFRIATWSTFSATGKAVGAAGWGLIAGLAAALALGALIAAGLPLLLPRLPAAGEARRASRRTVLVVVAVTGAALLAAIAAKGGPVGAYDAVRASLTGPVGQSGVRIGLGLNLRGHWWATAWDGFTAKPLGGWGAGTFRLLEQTTRTPAATTGSAHDSVLEALAGTGLAGGLPFIAAAIGLVGTALAGARRARPRDGAGACVVAVAAGAFLAQGLVDVGWSSAAVGVAMMAAIGAIAPAAERSAATPPWRGTVLAVGLAVLAAGLFAIPLWLGARETGQSTRVLSADPLRALALASSAHRAAPLAVEPLLAQADAYAALGQRAAAAAALQEAIRREPANYEPLLAYGTYLAFSWGQPAAGRAVLERALALSGGDPSVRGILQSLPAAAQGG